MTRPRSYWHCGGSIHGRGGVGISDDMALSLVDLFGDEMRAALAANDMKAAADAMILLTDIRTALADMEDYRALQRAWRDKPTLWASLIDEDAWAERKVQERKVG